MPWQLTQVKKDKQNRKTSHASIPSLLSLSSVSPLIYTPEVMKTGRLGADFLRVSQLRLFWKEREGSDYYVHTK